MLKIRTEIKMQIDELHHLKEDCKYDMSIESVLLTLVGDKELADKVYNVIKKTVEDDQYLRIK